MKKEVWHFIEEMSNIFVFSGSKNPLVMLLGQIPEDINKNDSHLFLIIRVEMLKQITRSWLKNDKYNFFSPFLFCWFCFIFCVFLWHVCYIIFFQKMQIKKKKDISLPLEDTHTHLHTQTRKQFKWHFCKVVVHKFWKHHIQYFSRYFKGFIFNNF